MKIQILLLSLLITGTTLAQAQKGSNTTSAWQEVLLREVFVQFPDCSLEEAIKAFGQKTSIVFLLPKEPLKGQVTSQRFHNVPLKEMLRRILTPCGYSFVPTPKGKIRIVSSQVRANLSGVVKNRQTGDPVPFANVFLEGTAFGTTTDTRGFYHLEAVSPGVYLLAVQVIGYHRQVREIFVYEAKALRQDFILEPGVLQMQEVTIVAVREERLTRPEVSRFSIQPRHFSILPSYGEKDLYRALQMMPGVVVTNDFKSQLYVRGGNSDQNLVLLDGGIIYNPFHFSGILSAFDVEALERVDFSSGGFSSEYGGRLSSVLAITSRKASEKWGGQAGLSPLSVRALLEGSVSRTFYLLLSARRSYQSYQANRMGGAVTPDFTDGIGRADLILSGNDRLTLSLFSGKDRVVLQEKGAGSQISSENLSSVLTYRRTWAKSLHSELSYTRGSFFTTFPPPTGFEEEKKNRLEDRAYHLFFEYLPKKSLQVKLGMDYRSLRIRYTSNDPVLTRLSLDRRLYETTGFCQVNWSPHEKWTLSPGLRLSRYEAGEAFSFEPRLSARYAIFNFLFLKGAAGRFSQNLVTIYNENDTYNPVEVWLPHESEMSPAQSDHLILGLSYETPDLILTLEGYGKRYRNLTHYNRERISPEDPFFVQGKGYSLGVDLSFQWIKENHQLWANYSFGKAQKELPFQYPQPGVESFHPRYDRRHAVNVALEVRPLSDLSVSTRFSLASGLPFSFMTGAYDRQSTWTIHVPGDWTAHHPEEAFFYRTALHSKRDAFRFPVYHRLDITVRYTYQQGRFTFEPYGQILNLYDQANVLYYDLEGKPYLSLPFLPIAGVDVRF